LQNMASVNRAGRTSASVKKARLEAERSKISARLNLDDEQQQKKSEKKKNRFDFIFKWILIGDKGVGKTCLLNRFLDQGFCSKTTPTFVANFYTKILQLDGHKVKLEIWDIGGSGKLTHLGEMFYENSSAIILVYDITRQDTLRACVQADSRIEALNTVEDPVKFLVGCKADLEGKRQVDEMTGQCTANDIGARWLEVSSVTDGRVENLGQKIVRDLLERNVVEPEISETDETEELELTAVDEVDRETEQNGPIGILKKIFNFNFPNM